MLRGHVESLSFSAYKRPIKKESHDIFFREPKVFYLALF